MSLERRLTGYDAIWLTVVALAYGGAREISFIFPSAGNVVMAVWPVSGIGLAAFLLNPRRLWPWILAVLFTIGAASNLAHGRPLCTTVGFTLADVIESVLCGWAIMAWCGEEVRFTRVKEVVALVFSTVGVMIFTSCLAAGTAVLAGIAPFESFWQTWAISGGLGDLIVGPLIVTWSGFRKDLTRVTWTRVCEGALLVVLTYWLTKLSMHTVADAHIFHPRPYVLTAALAWAAFRFGPRGVTFVLAMIATVAILEVTFAGGSLAVPAEIHIEPILSAQVFLAFAAVVGYLMAASFAQAKAAEEAARESEMRFRQIVETANEGIWSADETRHIVLVNQGMANMLGYSVGEIKGRHISEFVFEEDLPEQRTVVEALTSGKNARYERRFRRKDGTEIWALVSATPTQDAHGNVTGAFAMITDISDRKRTESQLRKRSRQLARLAEDLALTEHRQRRHLAERLHEGLQQLLFSARMHARALLVARDTESREFRTEALQKAISDAFEASRQITHEMASPATFHSDLEGALRWIAADINERHQLKVSMEIDHVPEDLPEVVIVLLHTAARELLFNIVKHAGVSTATARVSHDADTIVLEIADEGRGFDPDSVLAIGDRRGFGLFSIMERTELIGGSFSLHSAPGKGTRVRLSLPLTTVT